MYKYLFFKKRRKKYGIKDYRGKSVTEYTNRLLKQYFPKKMDLLNATEREVKSAVSYALAFKKRIPKFIIVNHTPFHIH